MASWNKYWTEERLAEVKRLYNLEWTNKEIAAHLGKTVIALRRAIYGKGITSRETHAFNHSRRMRGKTLPKAHKEAIARAVKDRWKDPAQREKLMESRQKGTLDPKRLRNTHRTIRGFDLPDHQTDEYRALRRKKFPAKECAAILKIPLDVDLENARIAKLHRMGRSVSQIGESFGKSDKWVRARLRLLKVEMSLIEGAPSREMEEEDA